MSFDYEASNRDNDAVLDAQEPHPDEEYGNSFSDGVLREPDEYEREAFATGLELGAKVEHRVAMEAVANAMLSILGKDGADGVINLGAAGRWAYRYDKERWERHYHADMPADYRSGIGGASK